MWDIENSDVLYNPNSVVTPNPNKPEDFGEVGFVFSDGN
jgi:hypothetical protein